MSKKRKRILPGGWWWWSLDNDSLVDIIMGQSPPGETYNKNKVGLPFFQGKADFGVIHPEPKVWCSVPQKIAEPNDILLSIRAPVGPTNIAKITCCVGRGLAAIRCKEGLFHKYLFFALRYYEKIFSSEGSGSIFDAIGKDEIKAIEFPLPPTPEDQIAIANNLERKMAEVEKMRQAALRQKEAIAAMRNAFLREVFISLKQEQHDLTSISEIADIIMGQSPDGSTYNKEGKGIPLLNGPTEFGSEHPIPVQWTTFPKKLCEVGDLIICVRGNTTGKMNWADQTYCLGRGVAAIRGKPEKGDTHFIRYALEYKITELLTGSERSTFPNIGKDDLNSFEIAVPENISVQEEIVAHIEEKIENIKKVTEAAYSQLHAIEALSGALLRKAFDFEKE